MVQLEEGGQGVVESCPVDFGVSYYPRTFLLKLVFDNAEMLNIAEHSAERNAEI